MQGVCKPMQSSVIAQHKPCTETPKRQGNRLDIVPCCNVQVLYGSFPIARCSDPYAAIRWAAWVPSQLCWCCCASHVWWYFAMYSNSSVSCSTHQHNRRLPPAWSRACCNIIHRCITTILIVSSQVPCRATVATPAPAAGTVTAYSTGCWRGSHHSQKHPRHSQHRT